MWSRQIDKSLTASRRRRSCSRWRCRSRSDAELAPVLALLTTGDGEFESGDNLICRETRSSMLRFPLRFLSCVDEITGCDGWDNVASSSFRSALRTCSCCFNCFSRFSFSLACLRKCSNAITVSATFGAWLTWADVDCAKLDHADPVLSFTFCSGMAPCCCQEK